MAGASGDLPLRPREMRDWNRALVLDTVARHEPITRPSWPPGRPDQVLGLQHRR